MTGPALCPCGAPAVCIVDCRKLRCCMAKCQPCAVDVILAARERGAYVKLARVVGVPAIPGELLQAVAA